MSTKLNTALMIYLIFRLGYSTSAQNIECGIEYSQELIDTNNPISSSKSIITNNQDCTIQNPNILSFPVMHHIVRRSDGTGGMSPILVDQIMADLDNAFLGAKIEFNECQSIINYIDSNSLYDIDDHGDEESGFYDFQYNYVNDDYINIFYVNSLKRVNGPSLSGTSSFPWHSETVTIIDFDYANNGSTIPHEIGHFFGLYHTHDDDGYINNLELVARLNCRLTTDRLCDTPADPGLFDDYDGDGFNEYIVDTNCNYIGDQFNLTDPIGIAYNPDVNNIMSYSQRHCRTNLSACQLHKVNQWANDPTMQALSVTPNVYTLENLTISTQYSTSGEYIIINNVDVTNTGDLTVVICDEVEVNDLSIASGGKFLITK